MAAQSKAGRSRRHVQHIDTDDALVARALEFGAWASANLRMVIAAAVVAVVVIGGGIYYMKYRSERQTRAATEFMELQRSVNPANPALAAQDIEAFAHRYEGTPQAVEARITLAQMYLMQDSAAKAVTALAGADQRIDATPVSPQAALLLAAAQQAAGDSTAAVATYLAVAEKAPEKFQQTQALENAAALQAQAGDHAGAADLYQRLLDGTAEGSAERQIYQMRLAEATAKAEAAAE